MDEAATLIEDNLRLLGATAIEDRLQVSAPGARPYFLETYTYFNIREHINVFGRFTPIHGYVHFIMHT